MMSIIDGGVKMKRGFILIELLASIVILVAISLIVVPTINVVVQNAEDKAYKEQIHRIEQASGNWSEMHTELLPSQEGAIYFLELDQLMSEGLIKDEDILDPRNDEEMNGCILINYQSSLSQYSYEYQEETCGEIKMDQYQPSFDFDGIRDPENLEDTVEVNTTYTFPKVTVTSYNGEPLEVGTPNITKNGVEVDSVGTSIVGDTYLITYIVYDFSLQQEFSKSYTIVVKDTKAPIITLQHPSDVETDATDFTKSHTIIKEASKTEIFAVPTAIVNDNSCGMSGTDSTVNQCDVTLKATISGSVDLATYNPDGYQVTYTAKDSSNNITVLILTVKVVDRIKPEITQVDGIPTTPIVESTLTVHASDNGSGLHEEAYSFDNGATWQASPNFYVNMPGIIYIKVRDKAGNISDVYVANMENIVIPEYTFDYTETDQTLVVPVNGTYQLEVCGAQGNGGGNGGCVTGQVALNKGDILVIKTGGTNGYNGGGSGAQNGGGATTITLNGTILVAGAGGGGGTGGTAGGSGTGTGGAKPSNCGSAGSNGSNAGGGGSSASCSYTGSCSYRYYDCDRCKEQVWDGTYGCCNTCNPTSQNGGTCVTNCWGCGCASCGKNYTTEWVDCNCGYKTGYESCTKTSSGNAGKGGSNIIASSVKTISNTAGTNSGNGTAKVQYVMK